MNKQLRYYSVIPSVGDYETPKHNNPLNENGNWFHLDNCKDIISIYELWLREWTVSDEIELKTAGDNDDITFSFGNEWGDVFENGWGDELKGTKQDLFEELSELIDCGILVCDTKNEWIVYNGKETNELEKILVEQEQIDRKFDSEEWYLTEEEALEAIKVLIADAKKNY